MTKIPTSKAVRVERHFGDRQILCYAQRPANLVQLFAETISRAPLALAIVDERQRLSYRELDLLADTVAAQLQARGLAAGERIVLLTGNCAEFCVITLAAWRIGLIIAPLNPRNVRAEVAFVLAQSEARALIHEDWLADRAPLAGQVESCAFIIETRDLLRGSAATVGRFGTAVTTDPGDPSNTADAMLASHRLTTRATVSRHRAREEDLAVLLYTSGTTGRPKGAMLTHLNLIHSILHFTDTMSLTEQSERSLLAVPISHVTGLVAVWLTMVAVAGTTVMMREFKAKPCLELLAAEQISHMIAVPAIYNLLLRDPDFAGYDLRHWRIGGFGGAPMPEPTIAALASALPGLTLMNAYGATETTSPVTLMPAGEQRANLDSVGKLLPCARLRVVDDDGRDLAVGQSGELWIAGPMVVPGYWNNPQASANEFVDGHWKSGDIGSIDAHGYVRVFDRKKDMINRGGYKVYSAEVESVLVAHEAVLEAAVIGQPDPVLGERSHAYLVIRDGVHDGAPAAGAAMTNNDENNGKLAAQLRAHCARHLADYKIPDFITLRTTALPRNPNGKVIKQQLRQQLRQT